MALPAVPRIPMQDHLRNSSQPTDVTFVVPVVEGEDVEQRTHTHDVVFPAHRDRLLSASSFFECLLAGSRSVDGTIFPWKYTDEVTIEDCAPDAFGILLRWMYGGEKEVLDSIRQSTFVAVLVAAERFNIQDLVSRLMEWGEYPRTADFFYEILNMLNHRLIGCANELTERCLKYFDKNAAALAEHPSFLRISLELLLKILARDSLCLREVDLYHAAIKWARAQVERAKKDSTHEAIREALGGALFLIRFPTMHSQEFTKGPAKDNILLAEEERDIYRSFHSASPASCAFNAEPRTGATTLPLRHFTPTQCSTCGARLNGDICPRCGCSYRPSVKCGQCRGRVEVGHAAFDWTWHEHHENDYEVAYLCSCGTPNLGVDYGPSDGCTRCGLKVWRCLGDSTMSTQPCGCRHCALLDRDGF